MLLWGSVFRGEGSGNEDNFLNSGCCAGPRFQVGKVPPLLPASVFASTVRQTAEKSNVFLGDDATITFSGTAAIAGREDGASASSVVASFHGALHSADDDADGDFTGALMGRATLAGAAHSADGGEAGDFPGALMVRANPGWCSPFCWCLHRAGMWWRTLFCSCSVFSSVRWRTLCSSRWMWGRRFCLRSWGALPEASGA